jgi:2-succinyl-5-enolpyruvyl-6-hydroxy-3-cyclohexene-1-carboxylate synthase
LRYAHVEHREQLQAVLNTQWQKGNDAPAQLIEIITDSRADAAARKRLLQRVGERIVAPRNTRISNP